MERLVPLKENFSHSSPRNEIHGPLIIRGMGQAPGLEQEAEDRSKWWFRPEPLSGFPPERPSREGEQFRNGWFG